MSKVAERVVSAHWVSKIELSEEMWFVDDAELKIINSLGPTVLNRFEFLKKQSTHSTWKRATKVWFLRNPTSINFKFLKGLLRGMVGKKDRLAGFLGSEKALILVNRHNAETINDIGPWPSFVFPIARSIVALKIEVIENFTTIGQRVSPSHTHCQIDRQTLTKSRCHKISSLRSVQIANIKCERKKSGDWRVKRENMRLRNVTDEIRKRGDWRVITWDWRVETKEWREIILEWSDMTDEWRLKSEELRLNSGNERGEVEERENNWEWRKMSGGWRVKTTECRLISCDWREMSDERKVDSEEWRKFLVTSLMLERYITNKLVAYQGSAVVPE